MTFGHILDRTAAMLGRLDGQGDQVRVDQAFYGNDKNDFDFDPDSDFDWDKELD